MESVPQYPPPPPLFNIAEFIDDRKNINCIHIYFSGKNKKIGWNSIKFNRDFINKPQVSKVVHFHNKNLVYRYELENDGQKVFTSAFIHDEYNSKNNLYAVGYNYELLPSHVFPCTDDIQQIVEIETYVFRINNRMFIYLEIENDDANTNSNNANTTNTNTYLYIKYNHADNMDLTKMQIDLSKTLNWIRRNVTFNP